MMNKIHNIIVKRAINWPSDFYCIPLALFADTKTDLQHITLEKQLTIISAGYHDDISIWALDNHQIAVLYENSALSYVGIQLFNEQYNLLGDCILRDDEYDTIAIMSDIDKMKTLLNLIE